jgi:hypothetical protein
MPEWIIRRLTIEFKAFTTRANHKTITYKIVLGLTVDSLSPRIHSALLKRRGVAQPGRALGSGPRGRRFKSSRPDQ